MNHANESRREAIRQSLSNKGKVLVTQLAKELKVTTETIRRDLDLMESEQQLKRIHGGAIKVSFDHKEPPHNQRRTIRSAEKERIGKEAAEIVQDNDILLVDVGTTICAMFHHLQEKKNLTIILNSVDGLNILIQQKSRQAYQGKIVFLGGEIDAEQMSCFGPIAESQLSKLYADKAFIAVGGISLEQGITGYEVNESYLSGRFMTYAKEVIVLVDSSKIGVRNFYKIGDWEQIDVVICDQPNPPQWDEFLAQNNIKWIVAP